MGGGEDHLAAGNGVGLVVRSATPFADIFCSDKPHKPTADFPVGWVAGSVFRANRHWLLLVTQSAGATNMLLFAAYITAVAALKLY